jgi:hypothetical protein
MGIGFACFSSLSFFGSDIVISRAVSLDMARWFNLKRENKLWNHLSSSFGKQNKQTTGGMSVVERIRGRGRGWGPGSMVGTGPMKGQGRKKEDGRRLWEWEKLRIGGTVSLLDFSETSNSTMFLYEKRSSHRRGKSSRVVRPRKNKAQEPNVQKQSNGPSLVW